MRVLVTGALGFVGSATLSKISESGDLSSGVLSYDLMEGQDICDPESLQRVIEDWAPSRILHLAAVARFADADADPLRAFTTNVMGTQVVAEAAEEFHVPLVYASTGSVYMPIHGVPPITEDFPAQGNSVYGVTKLLGELVVRKISSPWMILRYAHIYGPQKRSSGLVGAFLDRMNRGLAPVLYGGRQSNDFTYIDDVARANIAALEAPYEAWNQVYNIGTGEELTAETAIEMVSEVFGYKGPIEHAGHREVDAQRFVYDIRKAEQRLGFRAEYGFREGLERMRDALAS